MAQSQDDPLSGDLPVSPNHFGEEERPLLSHDVVATYVADAARSVDGIVELHYSQWKGLSPRVREMHAGGVLVRDAGEGVVDLEIHVRVAWDTVIPEVARAVEEAVRRHVTAFLSIDVGTVTLFIDEIAAPVEAGSPKEG